MKILQAHEAGVPLADLAREHGFAEGTIYTWKSKCGGVAIGEAKHLREFEAEMMLKRSALSEALNRNW